VEMFLTFALRGPIKAPFFTFALGNFVWSLTKKFKVRVLLNAFVLYVVLLYNQPDSVQKQYVVEFVCSHKITRHDYGRTCQGRHSSFDSMTRRHALKTRQESQ